MARIFHTSDWHVGRPLGRRDRHDEHVAVLAEIVQQARGSEPDLIIHSGDVFDALRPANQDLRLVVETLLELGEIAPTVVIAGNHDSGALFDVLSLAFGPRSPVRLITKPTNPAAGGILDLPAAGGSERIRLAPIPFIHPNRQVDFFEDPRSLMGQYAAKLQMIHGLFHRELTRGFAPGRDVLIYTGHLHVTGALLSGSEREVFVSEQYSAEAPTLPEVSYLALGHIHKPQTLRTPTGARYVGSPLQLDYGEAGEQKSSALVSVEPGASARIELLAITSGRQLVKLAGSLEEVLVRARAGVGHALVRCEVHSRDPVNGLADLLVEAIGPDAVLIGCDELVASRRLQVLSEAAVSAREEPDTAALLAAFLAEYGVRSSTAAAVGELFATLSVEGDEDDPAGVGELLGAELPEMPERGLLETA